MLAYNQINTTPEQLRPYLYIPEKGGSLAVELEARARQFNLIVYPLKPDVTDILLELDAGHPVLVMQNLGFSWLPQWHFAVAIGYDLNRSEEHTSELQSHHDLVCSLLLEKKKHAN